LEDVDMGSSHEDDTQMKNDDGSAMFLDNEGSDFN